ncbi:MAG: glycosyltransferase family 4 protein [Chitinophagales bacterium]|nr:glycosyltransferase family 4 protein [Chitinophagales bacterium]
MNILILNYEYPPLGGGAGIVTENLANSFALAGHKVFIVTTWFNGEPEYFAEGNITIVRLRSKRKYTFQSNPIEMYSWIRHSKAYFDAFTEDIRFDICLSNFTLPGGEVAIYLKKKWNLPYIILSHGHDIPWFSPRQMFIWHSVFYFKLKHLLKASLYNVLLSEELKRRADGFLGSKYTSKNVVIPNGFTFQNFRTSFEDAGKELQLLFVGRMVEQKDPLLALKVFSLLRKMGLPVRMKMIGDGKLKPMLENWIRHYQIEHIELTGKISQSQVLREMEEAHLLLAPSREEGMSLAVLEALSRGMYVLATQISGNTDVIFEGINGHFIVKREVEEIANLVKDFYYEKFLKGYRYPDYYLENFSNSFSWVSAAEKYLQLFRKASTNEG